MKKRIIINIIFIALIMMAAGCRREENPMSIGTINVTTPTPIDMVTSTEGNMVTPAAEEPVTKAEKPSPTVKPVSIVTPTPASADITNGIESDETDNVPGISGECISLLKNYEFTKETKLRTIIELLGISKEKSSCTYFNETRSKSINAGIKEVLTEILLGYFDELTVREYKQSSSTTDTTGDVSFTFMRELEKADSIGDISIIVTFDGSRVNLFTDDMLDTIYLGCLILNESMALDMEAIRCLFFRGEELDRYVRDFISYEDVHEGNEYLADKGYLIDLDSDGTKEKLFIAYEGNDDSVMTYDGFQYYSYYQYGPYIYINGERVLTEGYCDSPMTDRFFIYDINVEDPYLNIMTYDDGPSDDPCSTFYYYHDGLMTKMGSVPDCMWNIRDLQMQYFDGHGRIYVVSRLDVLQTWYAPACYAVNSEGLLEEELPELYYPMNETEVTLIYPMYVYTQRDENSDRLILNAGEVHLGATDNNRWVLVEAKDGSTSGWVDLDNIKQNLVNETIEEDVYAYDVFDGLCMVD